VPSKEDGCLARRNEVPPRSDETYLEREEQTSVETAKVAEHQEVPKRWRWK
jgi:hypothetical protein